MDWSACEGPECTKRRARHNIRQGIRNIVPQMDWVHRFFRYRIPSRLHQSEIDCPPFEDCRRCFGKRLFDTPEARNHSLFFFVTPTIMSLPQTLREQINEMDWTVCQSFLNKYAHVRDTLKRWLRQWTCQDPDLRTAEGVFQWKALVYSYLSSLQDPSGCLLDNEDSKAIRLYLKSQPTKHTNEPPPDASAEDMGLEIADHQSVLRKLFRSTTLNPPRCLQILSQRKQGPCLPWKGKRHNQTPVIRLHSLRWRSVFDRLGIKPHQKVPYERIAVHRILYDAFRGPVPRALTSQCYCANPFHWHVSSRGGRPPKLTDQQKAEIRTSTLTNKELVAKYQCSKRTIQRIRNSTK